MCLKCRRPCTADRTQSKDRQVLSLSFSVQAGNFTLASLHELSDDKLSKSGVA